MTAHKLPEFSIVMPSHNRRNLLARALDHISKQNYSPELVEVILVLDGCTDGSAEMVENLRSNFPFQIKVLTQNQGGPAAARNAGVMAASKEYILFLDDDVMVIPTLIEEHAKSHLEQPNTIVIGTMSNPADFKGNVWTFWEQYILEKQYTDILNERYHLTFRQFYTGNCSLKRQWIIDAGMFDETFKRYEDVELAFRLQQKLNLSFDFNPRAIGYHYVQRSFASWSKAHYLYGIYAVKIDRDKGVNGMIKTYEKEFEMRHWLTRWMCKSLLDHKTAQKIVLFVFLQISRLAWFLSLRKVTYRIFSSLANLLFWQGFNEELRLTPPSSTPNTSVLAKA